METDERHNWARLNIHQLGRYAEYLVKMEFVLHGCDVFTSEVDNHGIDFVIRSHNGDHYDVQVKSVRNKTSYVFMPKDKFRIHPASLLALVKFVQGEPPAIFLIHSHVSIGPNPILVSRDYGKGKKSPPEWGLSLTKKNMAVLEADCRFHTVVKALCNDNERQEDSIARQGFQAGELERRSLKTCSTTPWDTVNPKRYNT
jgi:hypothetical protein